MKRRRQTNKETASLRRAWTIVCLLFVCAVAILARGVLIYRIYPLDYEEYITQYSEEYGLDPYMVCAMINTESNFDPDVESHKEAVGLMQLMPSTAQEAAGRIGIENYSEGMLTDPETNIRIGCEYLHYLNGLFDGNDDYVIAAYNAGLGNVREWIKTDPALEKYTVPRNRKLSGKSEGIL